MARAARRASRARAREQRSRRRHQNTGEELAPSTDGTPTPDGAVATDVPATTLLKKLQSLKPKRRSKNDYEKKEEMEVLVEEKEIEDDVSMMAVSGAAKGDPRRADRCHLRTEDVDEDLVVTLVESKTGKRMPSRQPRSSLRSSDVVWGELFV